MIKRVIGQVLVGSILVIGMVGCESSDNIKKITANLQSINQNIEAINENTKKTEKNNKEKKEVKICSATRNLIPNSIPILCSGDWEDAQTTIKAEYKKGWRFVGVVSTDKTQIILER